MNWLMDFRTQQLKQFNENGLPTRKNEWWKYTDIQKNAIPDNAGILKESLDVSEWSAVSDILIVFVNGHFSAKLSEMKAFPKEVIACTINDALKTKEDKIKSCLLRERNEKQFPFATLNSAMMTDGLFLEIPKNVKCITPIHLLFIHTDQTDFSTSPHHIILANPNSQLTVIEEHVAKNAQRYFTNTVTEIHAGENARIDYYKIQDDDLTATHVGNVFVEQHKDSCVKTFTFSKNSRLTREDVSVWQKQDGAETSLHGLYVLSHDQQHVDHHVHVDHLASFGTSSMLYKGILDKKSRGVFNGKVHVHPAIKQINAHQENHNLLLSNDAEMNSKPELEIYAEDVKCTHGATIGQLDDEALFYLLSRGIEKNEAHRMLVHAFSEEVYDKIEDETIRLYIQQRMNHYEE